MDDVETVEARTPRVVDNTGGKTRGATALEVAALREEVDVVNVRLDDVDERVTALEAAHPEDRVETREGGSPSFVGRGRGDKSTASGAEGALRPNSAAPEASAAPSRTAPEATVPGVSTTPTLSTTPFHGSFIMVPVSADQIARLVGYDAAAETEATKSPDQEAQGEWRVASRRAQRDRAGRR
ncbi:MAG: hypothetical protein WB808_11730 [Candidatus Dormiibacterota bacterium]